MDFKLFLICELIGLMFTYGVEAQEKGKSESRIVGGKSATKPYAYQVSIDNPTLTINGIVYTWNHFCGGSIITERHILTAAHCVTDTKGNERSKDEVSVLVGTHHLSDGGTRHDVCQFLYHKKYLEARFNYDIAIITIKGVITFLPQKVELIPYSKEYTGANVSCVITGWGSTKSYTDGPFPTDLQELNVSTISYEQCHNEFMDIITENNLCTLSEKGEGACSGDSGGPLVDIKKQVLVGVINSVNGAGCAIGEPDFFARTSAFYDWIQENTIGKGAECDVANSGAPSTSDASDAPSTSGNSNNPVSSRPFSFLYNWLPKKP